MSSTHLRPRRRFERTRAATALAAAGALIMSAGVVGLIAGPASANHKPSHDPPGQGQGQGSKPGQGNAGGNSGKSPAPKVVVCKYVGTPGGELHHIVVVSENTLKNTPYVAPPDGDSWTDAHGKTTMGSVAIRYAQSGPPPEQARTISLSECPDGGQTSRTPAGIDVSDPCGPDNVTWSAKPDTYFDYAVSDGMIVATLKPQFADEPVSGTTSWALPVDSNTPCPEGLQQLAPAVTFTDPDCDDLDGAAWDGNLDAIVDYEETGDVGPGETVTVEAVIDPAHTDEYEFAPGAQTEFSHTFDDVTIEDCVLGEETIVPKPKPDDEPTVKGVQVVRPPAAAPTAVAAGLGGPATSPLQGIAQMLVAGGMLLLMAGAWIGLGRRETGTHEA